MLLGKVERQDILLGAGLPPFLLPVLLASESNIRAGKFALLTRGVDALTGWVPVGLSATLAGAKPDGPG